VVRDRVFAACQIHLIHLVISTSTHCIQVNLILSFILPTHTNSLTHSNPASPTLIPPSPINLINQLPPTPVPPNILPQHLKRPVRIHIRTTAHMRRDQHIRRRPQRVISRQWLRVSNIEGRAADEAVVQGLDERGLVDDLAA